MTDIPFCKFHGFGNDYIVLEKGNRADDLPELARAICKRNTGVGADGIAVGWNPPAFAAREQVRTSLAAIRARTLNATFYATPVDALSFPANGFDLVLLHLSYHDSYWEDDGTPFGYTRIDPATVTAALFAATRPGGTVAVVDHIANPGRETRAEVDATHRIDPAVVRADFERAGFIFDGETDLLRNREDDHSRRVFDPSIRGRTDRFVYRFLKPGRGEASR
jgi:predicted methyltransferase